MKKLTQIFMLVLLVVVTLCLNPRKVKANTTLPENVNDWIVDCPPSSTMTVLLDCLTFGPGGIPAIAPSHQDQVTSPDDLPDFFALGASTVFGSPCGDVIITVTDTNNGGPGCPANQLTYTRTYSVFDDRNGNGPEPTEMIIDCVYNYTIIDNIIPTFTAPADMTVFLNGTCMPDAPVAIAGDVMDEDDNCSMNLEATFVDDLTGLTMCNGTGVIQRTWSLQDDCGNAAADQIQQITVMDNSDPTALCQPITVQLDATGNAMITADMLNGGSTDNCMGGLTFSADITSFSCTDLAAPVAVILTVTDACGNTDTCIAQVTVEDNVAPMAVCQDITIQLDDMGMVSITPDQVDNGSSDQCMGMVSLALDRTDFFCNDIQTTSSVTLTVTDESGNTNTCSANVVVQDQVDPMLNCPSNLSVECIEDEPAYTTFAMFSAAGGSAMDNCSINESSFMLMNEPTTGALPCNGTYERTYVITDINGNTGTCIQSIIVEDTTSPSITCPDDILGLDCSDMVPAPATTEAEFLALMGAALSDNCVGMISISSVDNPTTAVFDPTGIATITRTYTATDVCGNTSTCEQTIQFRDTEAPSIVCNDPLIVALGGAGIGELNILAVFSSAEDNCDPDPHVSMVRMGTSPGSCNDPNNFIAGNDVSFCCADLITGAETRVIVTVTDAAGNSNTCMRTIIVEDNIAPTLASNCLPDITVSCEFPLDTADLSVFGSLVFDMADVEDIVVEGTTFGQDALVTDNCPDGLVVTEQVVGFADLVCSQGTFNRVFTVTDSQGNSSTCTQNITVMDADPFDDNDIVWPEDFELNDCMNVNADTTITGRPAYSFDKCTQLGESFKDKIFETSLSGCMVIQRDWEVLDWCQYVPNADPQPGIFTHTQYITVVNMVAPTFSISCADTIICANELTCNRDLDLTASATDDCTDTDELSYSYSFDLFGAGSTVFDGIGNNLKGSYPQGNHILTWTVEDRCGNSSTCSYTVTIMDCKEPDVVCYHGLSGAITDMIAGPMLMISVDRFIKEANDNCSLQNELTYSFASDVVRTDTIFDCCMLGQREINIFVTDAAGNQGFCTTYLEVQDNDAICPSCNPSAMATVAGKVVNEQGEGLSDVEVKLTSDFDNNSKMTSDQGGFSFPNVEMYQAYNLKPENDKNHLEGITTLDLVIIQKHILGLSSLDSPYKMIAADINNSESISAIDLLELRKLILGVTDELANNKSWRFVDSKFIFDTNSSPWPFDEEMEMSDLDQDVMGADFVGVKVGDVNGSINNAQSTETPQNKSSFAGVELSIPQLSLKEGQMVKIPLRAEKFDDIVGLQMELAYNIDLLEYRGVSSDAIDINQENIRANREGSLLISWNEVTAKTLKEKETLIELIFYVKQAGSTDRAMVIVDKQLKAEVYNDHLEIGEIKLTVEAESNDSFALYQNVPNPFKSETIIPFTIPADMSVTLIIFDGAGKLLHTERANFLKGENEWVVNKNNLGVDTGVVYYKIKAGSDAATKKMIIVE